MRWPTCQQALPEPPTGMHQPTCEPLENKVIEKAAQRHLTAPAGPRAQRASTKRFVHCISTQDHRVNFVRDSPRPLMYILAAKAACCTPTRVPPPARLARELVAGKVASQQQHGAGRRQSAPTRPRHGLPGGPGGSMCFSTTTEGGCAIHHDAVAHRVSQRTRTLSNTILPFKETL